MEGVAVGYGSTTCIRRMIAWLLRIPYLVAGC